MFRFLRALALFTIPTDFLAITLALIQPDLDPRTVGDTGTLAAFAWQLLMVGGIVPFLESWILVYPTVISSQATNGRIYLASAIGSAPLTLLHLAQGPWKLLVVSWPFFISAYYYQRLALEGKPFWSRFWFICGLHMINNALSVVLIAAARSFD